MDRRLLALGIGAAAFALVLGAAAFRVSRQARSVHGAEMGLLDHLRELRYRVLASLAAVALVSVLLFSFDVAKGTAFGTAVWYPVPSLTTSLASRGLDLLLDFALPDNVQLVVLTPSEGILAQFQAAIIGGLVIASPFVAFHVASFVAPALHPNEVRSVATVAPLAFLLFIGGVAFAVFVMVPVTLTTLYAYAEPLGATAFARPQDIVSFVLLTSALFGVAFETPLVMAGLAYAGILAPSTMSRHWRGVLVTALIVGAMATDPSPVTQMVVALPLVLLYVFGLYAARVAWRMGKRKRGRGSA